MIALLRKELTWLLPCTVLGTIAIVVALSSEGLLRIWTFPPTALESVFHTSWVCGAAIGVVAAVHDELLGTREYLRHRPVSPMRLHGARVVACALAILVWIVLGPGVHLGVESVFRDEGHGILLGNWFDLAAAMLPAASAAAIALFAGTLPTNHVLRLGVAVAAFLVVFTQIDLATRTTTAGMQQTDITMFVVCHLAASFGFAAASFASAAQTVDLDRPWTSRARVVGAGIAALVLAVVTAAVTKIAEIEQLRRLEVTYPRIGRVGDEFVMFRSASGERRDELRYVGVDTDHRPRGPLGVVPGRVARDSAFDEPRRQDLGFDEPRFHFERTMHGHARVYSDGRAFVVDRRAEPWLRVWRPSGKGPTHASFTPHARTFGEHPDCFVIEPTLHELWRFDSDLGHFVAVTLPNGDRPIEFRSLRREGGDEAREIQVDDVRYRRHETRLDVVVGEREVWQLVDGAFVAAPEWANSEVAPDDRSKSRTPPFRVRFHDVELDGLAQVVDAEDHVVFEHDYAPRTATEITLAAGIVATSMLRPPVLTLVAHGVDRATAARSPFLDHLVADGRRTWLLAANVVLSIVLAFGIHRRLVRSGAAAVVGRFWAGATLVLGPIAAIVGLVVDSRRAHAASPSVVAPRGPRISSPQPEGTHP